MNRKSIIILTVVLILIIVLVIITGKYPPPSADETGGTVGRVEKYRKVQMTAKDIILRSEVLSDTSKLSKSIYGLLVFNAFAKDYAEDLKTISMNMEKSSLAKKDSKTILDYSLFIDQNRKNVENVIAMLTDFYTNDTSDFSVDIEKKLIDFDRFVKNMNSKDSIVTKLLNSTEKYISANLSKKDDEIKKLQHIHDQILIKKLQLALFSGSAEQINVCSKSSLYDVANLGLLVEGNLNVILSREQLQNILQQNKQLGFIFNKDAIQNLISHKNIGAIALGEVLNQKALSSKNNLGIFSSEQLNFVAVRELGNSLAVIANSYIGIIIPNTVNSIELENVLSNSLEQSVQQKVLSSSVMNKPLGSL